MIVRRWPSTPTISSSPIFFSEMSPLRANGSARRSRAPSSDSSSSCVIASCSTVAGSVLARTAHRPSRSSISGPTTSCSKYGRAQHRHGRERRTHELQVLLLNPAPRREVVADVGGKNAVDDHCVGQIAVQVQVGERPHRLADHHLVRVHHEPDRRALAVAEDLVHRDQVLRQPLDVGEHGLARQRDVEQRAGERTRGGEDLALHREHLLDPPPGDVGERQQPQRLAGGAQSTMIASHSPESCCACRRSSENSSSIPGGTVSSSAEIRSTPRSMNSSPSHSWTPDQWRSISSWALTSWPHRSDRRPAGARRPARRRATRTGCAPDRSRSPAFAEPSAAQRRAVQAATEVFPTPPLPV